MEKKIPQPPDIKKPKTLVAATHILKKVALQRYRAKHANDPEWESPAAKTSYNNSDFEKTDGNDCNINDSHMKQQNLESDYNVIDPSSVPNKFDDEARTDSQLSDSSEYHGKEPGSFSGTTKVTILSRAQLSGSGDAPTVLEIVTEDQYEYGPSDENEPVPDINSQSDSEENPLKSEMTSSSDENELPKEKDNKEAENTIGESQGVPESAGESNAPENPAPTSEEKDEETVPQHDQTQDGGEQLPDKDETKPEKTNDEAIKDDKVDTSEKDENPVVSEQVTEAANAPADEVIAPVDAAEDGPASTPEDANKVVAESDVTASSDAADSVPEPQMAEEDKAPDNDGTDQAKEELDDQNALSTGADVKPSDEPDTDAAQIEVAQEKTDDGTDQAKEELDDQNALSTGADVKPSDEPDTDAAQIEVAQEKTDDGTDQAKEELDDQNALSTGADVKPSDEPDTDAAQIEVAQEKTDDGSKVQDGEDQAAAPQPDEETSGNENAEEHQEQEKKDEEKTQELDQDVESPSDGSVDKEKAAEENQEKVEDHAPDGEKKDEGGLEPPLVDTPTNETKEDLEEEGPPSGFFYNLDEYQSTSVVSADSGIPDNLLQFYHSYGYDCGKRSNLHLLKGPTALFAAGNLVHLLHLTTGAHRFIRSCSGGGIGAMAVHPSGKYFAVAEKGTKPHILIYEFPSLKLYRILRGGTEQAFSFIDFDPKGDLLASVGSYPDYMLTVWGWRKEKIMLRSKAFSQEVYRVTFSPEQEGQLTSSGTTHIRFWKMAFTFTGLKLKGELGRFGKTSLSDIEGYIQLPDGKVLSGAEWGNMLLWDGGLIKVEICRKNQKPCHIGSIQQLVIDEGELITIGLDGFVRVWELEAIDSADTTDESDHFEIEPMNELKVGNDVQLTCMVKAEPDEEAGVEDGSSIWFAQDANGGIWKLDLSFSHTTKPPQKLHSFTAGGIAGIVTSPASDLMATTGDCYVRVYEYLSRELLCQYQSPNSQSKGTAIVWPTQVVDPKGTMIVTGFSDGILRLLNLRQIDNVSELALTQALKPHAAAITSIKYDNTGELLATGSKDRTIFFFAVGHDKCDPIGFVSVPGEVTSMEWSPAGFPDTTLLVSCSNGKVVEISAPSLSAVDTTRSYKLSGVPMRYYTFQSIKSRLRRAEVREKKEQEKAERRKKREKELKRRKDRGEEISAEDAQAFLDEDPLDQDEEEEEPLFVPAEPNSILQAFYVTPGRFILSMNDYDAGYLYECAFKEKENEEEEPEDPVRAVSVLDSNDTPITTLRFSADRHKLFVGFANGQIRVYPLEADPETTFDLDMMKEHWNLNMHDNQEGAVSDIAESHDGAHVFSSGRDGNIFGYHSLAHEAIIRSMEGKRAKLPTPKKRSPDDRLIDDIDDPNAYSIEDAKLKAEQDKMMREAEAKKLAERRRINKLRRSFLDLLQQNNDLPNSVRLNREEFELDPSIRHKMVEQTQDKKERVRLEMQWEKEKLALTHRKLHNRFQSQLECDRVVVHACHSSHTVATYRVAKLPEEYFSLMESVEEKVRISSFGSDGGAAGVTDGVAGSLASGRGNATDTDDTADESAFLGDAGKHVKTTLLQGRQAEKVAKALRKAEETKKKHDKRQKEWEELYKGKPDKKHEDPKDVAAIKEAQANMGDFKLKTSSDYAVPEHLRMDTVKKRYQILTLQGLIHKSKSNFNQKLLALRDTKFTVIDEMVVHAAELKKIQEKLPKVDRVKAPVIPRRQPSEEPHKKFEYTRETLLKFEEEEKEREVAAEKKKRAGDGGLFGGFGDEPPPDAGGVTNLKTASRKTASSVTSSSKGKVLKNIVRAESTAPTALEQQLSQIENIRLKYHRDRLVRIINEKTAMFDAELRLLRHNKVKLDMSLKMADLRQITLLEELLLLKEYEKRETTLSDRVASKRTERTELTSRAAEMQVRLDSKKRDIERLVDREKALHASFTSSLGENNKFADYLNKVFKKKIKRAKKKAVQEGDEEDSDMSSSDESDYSSEEDEDDSLDGGFDDSVCPPGCDQHLFSSALALREKRLDLEEAIAEEKKLAETLKKDVDALSKKSKVMESQLKKALDDLEEFQVEKQGKLNELDVVVPLRFNQVEHVYNAAVPADLTQCLVFANNSLTALQRRIKELQLEKGEQRMFYKEARQQHVHLIKSGKMMEQKIKELEEKCEHMMMLKFGRIVDLDKLDSVTVNKNVEELKEQVRRNEVKSAKHIHKMQQSIDRLKDQIIELTRENTRRIERLNVLMNDNNNLELELDKRQKKMELGDQGLKKSEMQEQHRLVQLVQLQAQEIQALKEEIGLLSRKGGHILPPAQPPMGQDTDMG